MKNAFCLFILFNLLIAFTINVSADNNKENFEKTIKGPVWINNWDNMIYKHQDNKELEFKQNLDAFSRMHLKFSICYTYYHLTKNTQQMSTLKKHAAYFMSASVRSSVVRKNAEQPALKDITTPRTDITDGWNSDSKKLLKAKQLCTDMSKKIAVFEKKTDRVIFEEIMKAKPSKKKQLKTTDSKQLNYPNVVSKLLNFKNSPQDINAILSGIKGADNNGNPIYSANTMGKMYKKGYLGGYAMGVESYCPKIQKVSISTKNGNGVSVKIKENGKRHISWKFMNIYHSNGIKDGWQTAQRQRCNKKVAQSIIAAEIASQQLRICFFGVCQ